MDVKFNLRKGDKVWVSDASEAVARAGAQRKIFSHMDGKTFMCDSLDCSCGGCTGIPWGYAVPVTDAAGWIEWNADESDFCPVAPDQAVEVILGGGGQGYKREAGFFNWHASDFAPIIQYRILLRAGEKKEEPKTRYFTHKEGFEGFDDDTDYIEFIGTTEYVLVSKDGNRDEGTQDYCYSITHALEHVAAGAWIELPSAPPTKGEVEAINNAMNGAVDLLHSHIEELEGQLEEKTTQWAHQKGACRQARKRVRDADLAIGSLRLDNAGLRGSNDSLSQENTHLKEEIRALEEEMGNTKKEEETFTPGDRFRIGWRAQSPSDYILAVLGKDKPNHVVLISLEDGSRATGSFEPENRQAITMKEINSGGLSGYEITPIRKEDIA